MGPGLTLLTSYLPGVPAHRASGVELGCQWEPCSQARGSLSENQAKG